MIARTTRPPTPAAVLLAVAASMPSLRTNADDDAKPYIIKNGVVDRNTSPVIFTTKARVIGATDATGTTFAPSLVGQQGTIGRQGRGS